MQIFFSNRNSPSPAENGQFGEVRLGAAALFDKLAPDVAAASRVFVWCAILCASDHHAWASPMDVKADYKRPDEQHAARVRIAPELQTPALLEVVNHAQNLSNENGRCPVENAELRQVALDQIARKAAPLLDVVSALGADSL